MAPRFVEVSRPVEDGVAWASSLSETLGTRVRSILPQNASDILRERAEEIYNSIPDVKLASDVRSMASSAVGVLPEARAEAKYFLTAAFVVAFLRAAFVFWRSQSILANYGATKAMNKEL